MIEIRSILSGDPKFYLMEGLTTIIGYQNRVVRLGKPADLDGQVIDRIEDPALGVMIPRHGTSIFDIRLDVNSPWFTPIKRPDNGVWQKPCYHTTLRGEINLAEPINITEYQQSVGDEKITYYGQSNHYWVDDPASFCKLIQIARCHKRVYVEHRVWSNKEAIIMTTAEQFPSGGGLGWFRTRAFVAAKTDTGVKLYNSYTDMGTWSRWRYEDIPDADLQWANNYISSIVSSGTFERTVSISARALPYNRNTIIKSCRSLARILTVRHEKMNYPTYARKWGSLATQALKNARFVKTNQLEFWKDIAMTFSEVGAFKNLADTIADVITDHPALKRKAHETFVRLEKFKSGNPDIDRRTYDRFLKSCEREVTQSEVHSVAKAASDTYLGTYYGTRLFVSDLEEISNGLAKFIWTYYTENRKAVRFAHKRGGVSLSQQILGHEVEWSGEMNYTLCYNPYQGISEMAQIQEELGTAINFHQIWECIPFSFVVDWFADVTKVLEAFDYDAYLTTLSINYEQLGYKCQCDVSELAKEFGLTGSIEYSVYRRWYNSIPTVHPAAQDILGSPQNHFIQGAALLVSRG